MVDDDVMPGRRFLEQLSHIAGVSVLGWSRNSSRTKMHLGAFGGLHAMFVVVGVFRCFNSDSESGFTGVLRSIRFHVERVCVPIRACIGFSDPSLERWDRLGHGHPVYRTWMLKNAGQDRPPFSWAAPQLVETTCSRSHALDFSASELLVAFDGYVA